jgi:hypothetical protein
MTDQMTKRLIRNFQERNNIKPETKEASKEASKEQVDSDEDNPFEKTEFVCYDNTIIKFGKLKGKMHSELLKPENANYANWIMNQNKNDKFYYKSTCKYLEKRLRPTDLNLDITSTDYLYLVDKTNPTEEEVKRMMYFENNLSSHFLKLNPEGGLHCSLSESEGN